jgi:dienelactone hydrolase
LQLGADGASDSAPILVVLADRDPASPNVDRLYRATMEPARRSHRIAWVRGADHNFLSHAARRTLFSSTIAFLESPARPHQGDRAAPIEKDSSAKPPEL